MSLKIEGKKCPICNGYLFNEDEIVWCPECGAPHHKDCYKAINKCGFAELHGTQELKNMLKQPEEFEVKQEPGTASTEAEQVIRIRCNSCGAAFPINYDRCPNCSAENRAKNGNFFMFDMLGGVPKNEDIGEGVTAEKAGKFVALSAHKFLPKFRAFKNGRKCFFSFLTFLFPAANFASRKMYPAAFLSGIIETAGTLLTLPLSLEVSKVGLKEYGEIYAFMEQNIANKDFMSLFLLSFAGLNLLLLYRIVSALIFDKVYYKHTINKIKEIENESEDKEQTELSFRKRGGLNIFSFILTIMILQYLPAIIAAFIL